MNPESSDIPDSNFESSDLPRIVPGKPSERVFDGGELTDPYRKEIADRMKNAKTDEEYQYWKRIFMRE